MHVWHGNATILSPRAKRRHLHYKECRKSRTLLTRNISLRPLTMAETNSQTRRELPWEVGLYLAPQHFLQRESCKYERLNSTSKNLIYISITHPKTLKLTKIFWGVPWHHGTAIVQMRVEKTIFRYRKVTAKILSITRGAEVVGGVGETFKETAYYWMLKMTLNLRTLVNMAIYFRLHKRRRIS